MTDRRPGTHARAVMMRLPRPVRAFLAVWSLGVLFAPLLIGLAAFALLPFGAQRSINAGPPWEFWYHAFLPASFVAGMPLFILILIEEWPGRMMRPANYLRPLAKISLLMAVAWLWSGISVAFLRDFAAPVVANAILRPPVEEWTVEVVEARIGRPSPSRDCPNRLGFEIPTVSAGMLTVCAGRNSALFPARAGDRLSLRGRSGPFGITYRREDLILEPAGDVTR